MTNEAKEVFSNIRILYYILLAEREIGNTLTHSATREKGRDPTQSYDKSPYTNRNVKRAKLQHKQRHKKVRLHIETY